MAGAGVSEAGEGAGCTMLSCAVGEAAILVKI